MLRKWSALVLLLLVTPFLAQAQTTGKLTGTVTDAQTGEPLPGANVVIQGTTRGAAVDAEGNYTIIGIPVGSYDVRASFVGYQPVTVSDVEINAGYTRQLDFQLESGTQLEEVTVEYERPLIQNDAIGAPRVVTGEEIENLPLRGTVSVAALQGGVVSNEGSNNLYVRGGREQQVSYYVDGVKVIGGVNALGVPQQAVQQQEMLIGSIPARYGDAQSGIISITTKTGGSEFFGTFEGVTSEVLDGYGYNLGSATLGGPIVRDKLSFFVSAEGLYQSDQNPWAIETPRLTDSDFAMLQQTPQALQVTDSTGRMGYVPLPRGIRSGNEEEILRQLNFEEARNANLLPDGFITQGAALSEKLDGRQVNIPNILSPNRFEFGQSKEQPERKLDLAGNLTFTPVQSVNLRLGGNFAYDEQEATSGAFPDGYYSNFLYSKNRFFVDHDETWRVYGTWRQYLSDVTFYQLHADFTDNRYWYYVDDFSRDIEDTFFYGDVSHPANSTAQSYRQVSTSERPTGEVDADGNPIMETVYAYEDRTVEDGGQLVTTTPSTFRLPGARPTDYSKGHDRQFRLTGNATTQLSVHQLEIGGEFEQRTQRYVRFLFPRDLARYYNDVDGVEAGTGEGVDRYENLPYEAFEPIYDLRYGYDFRGLNEVDDQNVGAFVNATTGGAGADSVSASAYNVEPYQPQYYAGYLSDKIEFRDLVINLGVRVDVFDNNTLVLKDPLATVPVTRGGDLSEETLQTLEEQNGFTPGDDYAVYYAGEDIVGYHDLDQNFYDARGQESNFDALQAEGGRPQSTGSFSREVFTDYEPQVTFMPRIGVSFPITDEALFFANYNVTSQRPTEEAYLPFTGYQGITAQNRIANPKLKPETTTEYTLGFRQTLGERAALQLSGFYRNQDDLIQVRNVPEAFPSGYQSFRNVDFATIKGAEIEFDLRRTNNVSLNANYTFSHAQGTGSDASSLGVIAWRSTLGGYAPNFIYPTAFDRRHSFNLTADYRLGEQEGPMLFGAHVLENFGVNVVADIGSGMPYTRLTPGQPFKITESFTSDVEGGVNTARLPWRTLVNLRVDRRFNLGNGTALTAFLWIQNLFDTNNVLGVYRRSGQPDEDGFLQTQQGQSQIAEAGTNLGDPTASDAYRFHYGQYADAPVGLGLYHYSGTNGDLRYSRPRRTRIGVRFSF